MKELTELHAAFVELTEHEVPYRTCERRLYEFQKSGFTVEDLRLVVRHIKAQNSRREFKLSLTFGSVVGNLERFGDLLGEAIARKRQSERRFPPAKASVLAATGRPTETPAQPPRHISEFLKTP